MTLHRWYTFFQCFSLAMVDDEPTHCEQEPIGKRLYDVNVSFKEDGFKVDVDVACPTCGCNMSPIVLASLH